MSEGSEQKNICETCGGSGALSSFQGENRFFLNREECPVCSGFGYIVEKQGRESASNEGED